MGIMKLQDRCRLHWILLVCVAVILGGRPVYGLQQALNGRVPGAQPDRGEVSGTVKDEIGEAVLGASVTLFDGGQHLYRTNTDVSGMYAFHDVAPGRYRLDVSQTGFA